MLYPLIVRLLFFFDPEEVHYFTLHCFRFCLKVPLLSTLAKKLVGAGQASAPVEFLGMHFKNPVGLAAGFDKDARYMHEFAAMGFGFIEVGTVTPLPQPGNDKPRLFRLIKDKAIINRMGFNNQGVEPMVARLKNRPPGLIIGGNIGKNKNTPNEKAIDDYEKCFRLLYDYVDYFVVNVSSPNTPGLRELQEKEPLQRILQRLLDLRKSYIQEGKPQKPVLLKIAPDLTEEQLDDVVEIVLTISLDGIVATNTTIAREPLLTDAGKVKAIGAGGLSGKPVLEKSTAVLQYLQRKGAGKINLIGVGGIHSAADALQKKSAGAQLVQLYTGFIYEGPALISRISKSWK